MAAKDKYRNALKTIIMKWAGCANGDKFEDRIPSDEAEIALYSKIMEVEFLYLEKLITKETYEKRIEKLTLKLVEGLRHTG